MNGRTRKALKNVESKRFAGRCKPAGDCLMRIYENIIICDEILDEQDGVDYGGAK